MPTLVDKAGRLSYWERGRHMITRLRRREGGGREGLANAAIV